MNNNNNYSNNNSLRTIGNISKVCVSKYGKCDGQNVLDAAVQL